MTTEPRHLIWITLDENLFCIRSGFGDGVAIGKLIHHFLIAVLEESNLSEDPVERHADFRPLQICTYRDGFNGKSKMYHVPKNIAVAFRTLNMGMRDAVKKFADDKEEFGKNILFQMLKSDVLGEALKT